MDVLSKLPCGWPHFCCQSGHLAAQATTGNVPSRLGIRPACVSLTNSSVWENMATVGDLQLSSRFKILMFHWLVSV